MTWKKIRVKNLWILSIGKMHFGVGEAHII